MCCIRSTSHFHPCWGCTKTDSRLRPVQEHSHMAQQETRICPQRQCGESIQGFSSCEEKGSPCCGLVLQHCVWGGHPCPCASLSDPMKDAVVLGGGFRLFPCMLVGNLLAEKEGAGQEVGQAASWGSSWALLSLFPACEAFPEGLCCGPGLPSLIAPLPSPRVGEFALIYVS